MQKRFQQWRKVIDNAAFSPQTCRSYTASDPQMFSIFVLSIKFKQKFTEKDSFFNWRNGSVCQIVKARRTNNKTDFKQQKIKNNEKTKIANANDH